MGLEASCLVAGPQVSSCNQVAAGAKGRGGYATAGCFVCSPEADVRSLSTKGLDGISRRLPGSKSGVLDGKIDRLRTPWEALSPESCSVVQPGPFCSADPANRIHIQARFGTVDDALRAARHCVKEDDAQQAFSSYVLALDLDEDNAAVCDEFGQFLLTNGQLDGADVLFSRAVSLDPLNAEYCYRRGVVLQQRRQAREAVEAFTCALQIDPMFAGALFSRGAVHCALGNYQLAADDFNRILMLDEDNHCALALLSECLAAMGDLDGAVKSLKHALRLDPTNRSIQKDLQALQHRRV